ncbi:MAG: amino acid permease [Spirochaetes bacterium]|nr:amino acid permease [Spirochaetota bacterium]
MSLHAARNNALNRTIGLVTSTSLVVGCVIGTGIFLKPATLAAHAESLAIVIAAWVAGGLLSYSGALTYGELCARLPMAGGEYAILRETWGRFPAYLYGWMRFTIGAPGSAASYAVGAATFLHVALPYEHLGLHIWQMAVFFILLFTVINTLTIHASAWVQVLLTAIKVLSLLLIIGLLFFVAPPSTAPQPPTHWPGALKFSAALMAVLWAYDGWNNLPMLGGEVKNAQRNLPLALAFGLASVIIIYVVVNLALFRVLSFGEVLAANPSIVNGAPPVATAALEKILPNLGVRIVAILMLISALSAMNGSILASARVPYAMAADGVFFRTLGKLSSKHALPIASTLAQGAVASVLAFSGTFDQLTDSVVFASWLFYGLTAAAIFKLRRMHSGDTYNGFKTPLYPILPLLFLVCAAAFVIYAIIATPGLTAIGLGAIAAGIPLYFVFTRREN